MIEPTDSSSKPVNLLAKAVEAVVDDARAGRMHHVRHGLGAVSRILEHMQCEEAKNGRCKTLI